MPLALHTMQYIKDQLAEHGFVLLPDLDNEPTCDYIMQGEPDPKNGGFINSCWIQMGEILAYIRYYENGVVVDLAPTGNAELTIAGCSADFYQTRVAVKRKQRLDAPADTN